MTHTEAVSFIKDAVIANSPENWADLGCGSGTFTRALIDLLPQGSQVMAVDRDRQRLYLANVNFVKADFEKDELNFTALDGVLIGNAIHYVADKIRLRKKLAPLFKADPKFLIIEYDTDKANSWVPYPISFEKLNDLFRELGYQQIEKCNERPSAYQSGGMYCALITKTLPHG